jgi:hypothetical protein
LSNKSLMQLGKVQIAKWRLICAFRATLGPYKVLTRTNEVFFHRNPKLQINFGAFGVFSADLSAPIPILVL